MALPRRTVPIALAAVLALLIIVGFFYFQNQRNKAPEAQAVVTAAAAAVPVSAPSTAVSSMASPISTNPSPSSPPGGTAAAPAAPDLTVDANGLSKATVLMTTTKGMIKLKFYPQDAPNTVKRIIELIQQGFYNGLTFHRVVPGFVIQGGDPLGNGTGGSGQKLKAEFNNRRHIEGTVAMARASDPDSADSQFYISLGTHPHLDHNYTVFGQVIEGMDVAKRITVGDKMTSLKIVNGQ